MLQITCWSFQNIIPPIIIFTELISIFKRLWNQSFFLSSWLRLKTYHTHDMLFHFESYTRASTFHIFVGIFQFHQMPISTIMQWYSDRNIYKLKMLWLKILNPPPQKKKPNNINNKRKIVICYQICCWIELCMRQIIPCVLMNTCNLRSWQLIDWLIVYGFTPAQEFFLTFMETSPLPVKGCKI
jgi:hypothetical protein